MTERVQLFSALLALFALGGTAALLAALLLRRRVPLAAAFVATVSPLALTLAAIVTASTMVGSLYFSEIAGFTPCKLCWYQRIAAFSMAIVLPAMAWRGDHRAARYLLPLPTAGIMVSTYHWVLEHYPNIKSSSCEITAPCTAIWFEEFGFLTLSSMAWACFAAVITLIVAANIDLRDEEPATPAE